MSSAKKKPTKSAAKAPARKAASPKAAPPAARKKAAKPAARREEPAKPAEPRAPRTPRTRASQAAAAAAQAAATGTQARSRLGAKWVCFTCGAKFYDLNKPEPLCPKCGANQNLRPKRDPRPKVVVEAPPPRPVEPDRDILPIEEDEDDALIMEDEEIDLGAPELDGEAEEFPEEEEEDAGDA
jgi:uncharacterized protein (TIGR02300 family)